MHATLSYFCNAVTLQDAARQTVSLTVGPAGIRVLQENTETALFEWLVCCERLITDQRRREEGHEGQETNLVATLYSNLPSLY